MPLSSTDLVMLSRLLDQALELPAAAREGFVEALPPEQQHLVAPLRGMLAREPTMSADSRLQSMPSLPANTTQAHALDRVGPYRLLHELGHGGMGTVWLAERADGSFKREVALKLPRLAWDDGLAARMARERNIGALLEHPNIARLYDAGVDEQGRPYLALELITGRAIDAWCRERALDVRERLRLFVSVVRAVAYAHGRLVVHRDLKPSNVMVDDAGQVHLLDFGIAKLLNDAVPGGADLTLQQGRALTPLYASPEQVAGEPVTVQSDIYSLGALLYELLTGQLPIAPARSSLGALEDAILRGDAPPASTRVKDRAAAKALRGEVDAILAKAMRREPTRRYATADALALDIERYLEGETVTARPDSLAYRLRKAARRHWLGVSATVAVLLAVLGGSATAVIQAQRVAKALERERVVKAFVAEVLRVNARPGEASGGLRTAPADAFLERSAKLVQSRFAGQPALQAELFAMVGTAFADMGASHLAAEYALRQVEALNAARAAPGAQAHALLQLATALLDQHRFEDAEQRAMRAASLAEDEPDLILRSQVIIARSLAARDQFERLENVLRAIDAGVARSGAAAGASAAWSLGLRARMMLVRNQRVQAVPMLERAIDQALVAEGLDSSTAIELRLLAAKALAGTSSLDETQRHLDLAVAAMDRRGAEPRIRAAFEIARLAAYRYRATGQFTAHQALAAIAEAREKLAAVGRVLPSELGAAVDFIEADVLSNSGRVAEGMALAERAFPVLYPLAAGPSERRQLAFPFGRMLAHSGRHELADHWLREALRAQIEAGLGQHPFTAEDYVCIALNLSMRSRYNEALAFLDTAPSFPQMPDEISGDADVYNHLLELQRSYTQLDRGDARQALKGFPRALLESHDGRLVALPIYGLALCELGQVAQGLTALREALSQYEQLDDETAPWTAHLRARTARCALRQGDRMSADRLAAQARAAFRAQPEVSLYFKAPLRALEIELGSKLPPV